ncbi:MAG: response regulator [Chloroflexi bacterium]|nr:response regulator [Chloroflexota bacterium]
MRTILIIDDSEDVCFLMQHLLARQGFEVLIAQNGREGLALAETHLPDLIFCDVGMPELNGYETEAALRQDPATAAIPFVFLSAASDTQFFSKLAEVGPNACLQKPFSAQALVDMVHRHLP